MTLYTSCEVDEKCNMIGMKAIRQEYVKKKLEISME